MPTVPKTFAPNTKILSADVNTNFTTLANAIVPTFIFPIVGVLVVASNTTNALIVNNTLTISKAYAYVKTAPTGAALIIDILKNGTSIWNATPANRLTIAVSTQTATQTSFDTVSLVDGDILTMDVIQVGSTVAGADLTVQLKCT